MSTDRPTKRLLVDFEASMFMGAGIVVDLDSDFVAECPTIEDAIEMVAAATGQSTKEVEEGIRIRMEYLNNLRRGRKRGSPES